jgi:hypothetical protein
MNEELIESLKECDVFLNNTNKTLSVVWKPENMTDAVFRLLLEKFASIVLQNKPTSIFVDARLHKHAILLTTQNWHDEVIVPRYIAGGVKRMAFLTPENVFSELGHKRIFDLSKAKSTLDTRFFKDKVEALTFLES